ncbi:hypothetical protein KAR91_78905 [Candidatus Pacearchaeota archaeon]|nr:hypothetical protein [Candidatus Pacearchaeota archaeon]
MIKQLICAILGHAKPTEFLKIFQFYTKHKNGYYPEGKFYRCRRCHKLVYLRKGVLMVELIDIIEATLQDLKPINFLKG